MDEHELACLRKAGTISKEARDLGASLVREGGKLVDVAEEVEALMIKKGARPAFPVNIGINDIAAHYTPSTGDKTVFSAGDIVKVVYYIWKDKNIVAEILLYAPFKNDNNRCQGWDSEDEFKIPPGIEKKLLEELEKEFNEDADKDAKIEAKLAQVYAMFCQGFGWGEIKNAFKLSNADYTPQELMVMKAAGTGWGQLKKELDLKPEKENNGKGPDYEETGTPGNPDKPGKPDNPGNSDHDKDKDKNGKNK